MNAAEKAKVLKANGYECYSTGSAPDAPAKYRVYSWLSKKGAFVPNARSKSLAEATHVAYEHYLASLELQVEETAQAANDAAGESDYAEVVEEAEPRYVVGKRTNEYCWYVWDNEESEEASKNIWDESEAQKRADEMNANDPVQLKKQNESLLEENHALHSEIQALKIQLAEKDKRIEELDTAIIRYRDYALNLQYALKRAGLSIEVDNVPAPVAGEAAQDGEVLMTDATWPTLFSSEIDWLARNILLAKESHAFTFYNSTDAADLVGRVTHNLHTCIMLNSEYDTPANRAAIANRRKELGL